MVLVDFFKKKKKKFSSSFIQPPEPWPRDEAPQYGSWIDRNPLDDPNILGSIYHIEGTLYFRRNDCSFHFDKCEEDIEIQNPKELLDIIKKDMIKNSLRRSSTE